MVLKTIVEATKLESVSYFSARAIAIIAAGKLERRITTLAVIPLKPKIHDALMPRRSPPIILKALAWAGSASDLILVVDNR